MKRTGRALINLLLCLCILFSVCGNAAAADEVRLTARVLSGAATLGGSTITLEAGKTAAIAFEVNQEISFDAYGYGVSYSQELTITDLTNTQGMVGIYFTPTYMLGPVDEVGTYILKVFITKPGWPTQVVHTARYTVEVVAPRE